MLFRFFSLWISGINIIFWWRHRLTRKYLEDAKARDMDALQKTILEKDEKSGG
jgi:hypothetical protein